MMEKLYFVLPTFCIPLDQCFYLIVETIGAIDIYFLARFLFGISCVTESRVGIYHNCKSFLSTKNRGGGCWKNKWPNLHGTTVSGIPVLRMWPLFTFFGLQRNSNYERFCWGNVDNSKPIRHTIKDTGEACATHPCELIKNIVIFYLSMGYIWSLMTLGRLSQWSLFYGPMWSGGSLNDSEGWVCYFRNNRPMQKYSWILFFTWGFSFYKYQVFKTKFKTGPSYLDWNICSQN